MSPINFNSIANDLNVPNSKNNFSNQLCPDQYVGEIIYNAAIQEWAWAANYICTNQAGRMNIDYTGVGYKNCILIILESPHFDEYDTNTHQAKGPAMGLTGKLFEKHFLSIINGINNNNLVLDKDLTYNIIFVNSVQYQASQGMKPLNPSIRDKNWLDFWYQGFNADLCKRVREYGFETIVINMCTYGQNMLHNRVQGVLRCGYRKHEMNMSNLHQSYHPSTWWIKSRRKIWR